MLQVKHRSTSTPYCPADNHPKVTYQIAVQNIATCFNISLHPTQGRLPGVASEHPRKNSECQVVQFITDLGLGHISEKFRENAVDGQMLLDLSEEDMCAELGLQKLQARKVVQRLPK